MMPARRRWIDPQSGDYVVELGRPRADATRASQVVFLLLLERGSSAVAPELGNPWLAGERKLGDGADRRIVDDCLSALAPLITPRFIRDVTIEPTISDDGTVELDVSFEDDEDGPQSLNLTLGRGP